MASEPQSQVTYTNNDDGIWLSCLLDGDLHWEENLGFYVSVERIVKAWLRHLNAVHPEMQE